MPRAAPPRYPAEAGSRYDIWLFKDDGSDSGRDGGRNLSARHDLMPDTAMNSDITLDESARLVASSDGAWLTFTAPRDGSYALWRISTDDGRLERLTEGREYVSAFDQIEVDGGLRLAFIHSTPTELPDVWVKSDGEAPRRLSHLNDKALEDVKLVAPVERSYEVDGRHIQGWLIEAPESSGFGRPGPLVVEIHGGPQTQYGWSPVLEFQILAGTGMSVFYCNPRGSTGYGQTFANANYRDWGHGPTLDVLAGVDALVDEGIADGRRLGVTGGSYGGYLTNWIVGHDRRFAAAFTARSVSDMTSLMLTGDLAGIDPKMFIGANPWEEPEFCREQSAARISRRAPRHSSSSTPRTTFARRPPQLGVHVLEHQAHVQARVDADRAAVRALHEAAAVVDPRGGANARTRSTMDRRRSTTAAPSAAPAGYRP